MAAERLGIVQQKVNVSSEWEIKSNTTMFEWLKTVYMLLYWDDAKYKMTEMAAMDNCVKV